MVGRGWMFWMRGKGRRMVSKGLRGWEERSDGLSASM